MGEKPQGIRWEAFGEHGWTKGAFVKHLPTHLTESKNMKERKRQRSPFNLRVFDFLYKIDL